jgi:hypothetical protein
VFIFPFSFPVIPNVIGNPTPGKLDSETTKDIGEVMMNQKVTKPGSYFYQIWKFNSKLQNGSYLERKKMLKIYKTIEVE